jgi:hypothetical protein
MAKVTGGWSKLYNEKLHSLNSLPKVLMVARSRTTRVAGHVACMDKMRSTYKILVVTSVEETTWNSWT